MLADGRRQITGFLYPGDFLGLALTARYVYFAEAITPSALCRFRRDKLEELCEKHPEFEKRLLENASHELIAAQDQMVLLGQQGARERVATFLLMMSRRAAQRGGDRNSIMLPMRRYDIADYLGLSTETVSRTMSDFKRDGIVELPDSNDVKLLDPSALEEISGIEIDLPDESEAKSLLAGG
jgi:CRP/FNR family transcriptional regulator